MKRGTRVRINSAHDAAEWLRRLHGKVGVVDRDDLFAARIRFDDGDFARVNTVFLELEESPPVTLQNGDTLTTTRTMTLGADDVPAGTFGWYPHAGKRRKALTRPDGQLEVQDDHGGWIILDNHDLDLFVPNNPVRTSAADALEQVMLDPERTRLRHPHSRDQIRVPNQTDPAKTHGEPRYWRYDPDQDLWISDVQTGSPFLVVVGSNGIGLNYPPERKTLNPGDARWVALRLAEAAAIYETLVADPPPAGGFGWGSVSGSYVGPGYSTDRLHNSDLSGWSPDYGREHWHQAPGADLGRTPSTEDWADAKRAAEEGDPSAAQARLIEQGQLLGWGPDRLPPAGGQSDG